MLSTMFTYSLSLSLWVVLRNCTQQGPGHWSPENSPIVDLKYYCLSFSYIIHKYMPAGNTNIVCKTLMCPLLYVTCMLSMFNEKWPKQDGWLVTLWQRWNIHNKQFLWTKPIKMRGTKTCAASHTACQNYDYIYIYFIFYSCLWNRHIYGQGKWK